MYDLDELMKLHAAVLRGSTLGHYTEARHAFFAAAHAAMPQLVAELKELRQSNQNMAGIISGLENNLAELQAEHGRLEKEIGHWKQAVDLANADFGAEYDRRERLENAALDVVTVLMVDDKCIALNRLHAALAPEPKRGT
jgi:sigma54-dependent transcription regulator